MQRWKQRPPGSNWGEFGPDDQIGRMNLITPERRRAALREAVEGIAFCLSLPLDRPGGSGTFAFRKPPVITTAPRGEGFNYHYCFADHKPGAHDVACDDNVTLSTQYSTQWDSLAHMGQRFDADGDGVEEIVYYNGFRAGEDILAPGQGGPRARALGIENLATTSVQGRGVMVDLHKVYGRKRAFVGYDALMRAMEAQKAEVETGDLLCLYTGLDDVILEGGDTPDTHTLFGACAVLSGRDAKLLNWIADSNIAAICSDSFGIEMPLGEVRPGERVLLPIHELCLFKLGIHLGELWYLSELAAWLATHGRTRFLLTAPPLRLPGSVGSPVTPIATV